MNRPPAKRGRPPAGEVELRQATVLRALSDLLAERGYRGATTAAVAERAGVSKESIYNWFGNKASLLGALVQADASRLTARLARGLEGGEGVAETLTGFGTELLTLWLGEASQAIHRAAIAEMPASRTLARLLTEHGQDAIAAMTARYLDDCVARGLLPPLDTAEAAGTLLGLLVRDHQLRVLLGAPVPSAVEAQRRAGRAVGEFLAVVAR